MKRQRKVARMQWCKFKVNSRGCAPLPCFRLIFAPANFKSSATRENTKDSQRAQPKAFLPCCSMCCVVCARRARGREKANYGHGNMQLSHHRGNFCFTWAQGLHAMCRCLCLFNLFTSTARAAAEGSYHSAGNSFYAPLSRSLASHPAWQRSSEAVAVYYPMQSGDGQK
jgi:hypothetical protein